MRYAWSTVVLVASLAVGVVGLPGCSASGPATERASSERARAAGNALHRLDDFAGAVRQYDQAIAHDPSNALAYNDRGAARRRMGDLAGALNDFNRGIALDPRYGTLYYNRGFSKAYLVPLGGTPADLIGKDPDGALADYATAIALNPADYDARVGRMTIFIARGDFGLASGEIDGMIAQTPQGARIDMLRGMQNLLNDREAEADACFKRAFKADPASRSSNEADIERLRRRCRSPA